MITQRMTLNLKDVTKLLDLAQSTPLHQRDYDLEYRLSMIKKRIEAKEEIRLAKIEVGEVA